MLYSKGLPRKFPSAEELRILNTKNSIQSTWPMTVDTEVTIPATTNGQLSPQVLVYPSVRARPSDKVSLWPDAGTGVSERPAAFTQLINQAGTLVRDHNATPPPLIHAILATLQSGIMQDYYPDVSIPDNCFRLAAVANCVLSVMETDYPSKAGVRAHPEGDRGPPRDESAKLFSELLQELLRGDARTAYFKAYRLLPHCFFPIQAIGYYDYVRHGSSGGALHSFAISALTRRTRRSHDAWLPSPTRIWPRSAFLSANVVRRANVTPSFGSALDKLTQADDQRASFSLPPPKKKKS